MIGKCIISMSCIFVVIDESVVFYIFIVKFVCF